MNSKIVAILLTLGCLLLGAGLVYRNSTATQEKKKRTPARQFLKEVRQELRKVDWPTREETMSYSIVVLVTVIVLTTFVFFVDLGFSKAIVNLFGN